MANRMVSLNLYPSNGVVATVKTDAKTNARNTYAKTNARNMLTVPSLIGTVMLCLLLLVGIELNPGPPRRTRNMRRRNRRGVTSTSQNKPPQLKSNIILNHKYRFTSDTGTATAISSDSLLGAAGTIGTTVLLCTPIFSAVKVNRVRIWAPPAAQGGFSTCSCNFEAATVNTSNLEVSDTSNSVSSPATINAVPPKNSLASFWSNSGGGTLFTLVAPSGSIIDVDLSLYLTDADASPPTAIPVGTAVIGTQYYLALDCFNNTHIYTPVSLNTTF